MATSVGNALCNLCRDSYSSCQLDRLTIVSYSFHVVCLVCIFNNTCVGRTSVLLKRSICSYVKLKGIRSIRGLNNYRIRRCCIVFVRETHMVEIFRLEQYGASNVHEFDAVACARNTFGIACCF